jgi:hypothetical protein
MLEVNVIGLVNVLILDWDAAAVVAKDPAVVVISPVKAGNCDACNMPLKEVVGTPEKFVPVKVGAPYIDPRVILDTIGPCNVTLEVLSVIVIEEALTAPLNSEAGKMASEVGEDRDTPAVIARVDDPPPPPVPQEVLSRNPELLVVAHWPGVKKGRDRLSVTVAVWTLNA